MEKRTFDQKKQIVQDINTRHEGPEGKTIRALCQEHSISVASYNLWKNYIKKRKTETIQGVFEPKIASYNDSNGGDAKCVVVITRLGDLPRVIKELGA